MAKILFSCCITPAHTKQSNARPKKAHGPQQEFSTNSIPNLFNPCPAEPGYTLFCKQCRSRSVGFFRSQLIWICTVCHQVCKFITKIWIKLSDWLKIRSGCGFLIYSAGQWLTSLSTVFQSHYNSIDPHNKIY